MHCDSRYHTIKFASRFTAPFEIFLLHKRPIVDLARDVRRRERAAARAPCSAPLHQRNLASHFHKMAAAPQYGIPSNVPQPKVGKDGLLSGASVHAAAVLRNYQLNPRLGAYPCCAKCSCCIRNSFNTPRK
jgi:hypothetical protein